MQSREHRPRRGRQSLRALLSGDLNSLLHPRRLRECRDRPYRAPFINKIINSRRQGKAVNRIKAAKFTVWAAFEDFDFTAKRSITKAEIERLRLRENEGKWILRRVLDRYIPRDPIERPKARHAVALGQSLRGQLRDWAHVSA